MRSPNLAEAAEDRKFSVTEMTARLDQCCESRRVRGKLDYSGIAFELVPVTFTIPELRHVFAIVTGKEMDPGNFRRRFNRMIENGVLEKAPGKRITVS